MLDFLSVVTPRRKKYRIAQKYKKKRVHLNPGKFMTPGEFYLALLWTDLVANTAAQWAILKYWTFSQLSKTFLAEIRPDIDKNTF